MDKSATITVLFTDVVGSTELRTRRGDASAHQILKKHFELVRPYIEQYSGQEVKTIGDSLMVAFESAQSAVECAVAVQRALAEHNRRTPEESVNLRMGLNTGAAIYEDGDFFGTAVNAASRIVSKAAGGQILLSEATRSAIAQSKDFALIDRGPFWLRGFPERWRLYEVLRHEEKISTASVPVSAVERTPFVNRENELAELRRYLDHAKSGEGALVMVAGEPGVGKTRLTEQIVAEARLHGLLAFSGRCYDMEGAPPYIPFVETIEAAARTVEPEQLREVLGDSAPEVAKLMPELRRLFPDIPPPAELPPEQERHCMFNGVRDFIERAAQVQPILVVLEDLQWSDESTLHLLRHVAQRLHEMPVLMLGTYRDTEVDKAVWLARCLEELMRLHLVQRVSLKRLPEPAVSALLEGCAGREAPALIAHMVFTETGGNPFFVEELFKHLSEEGKLFNSHGRWRSALKMEELDVPESVRLVIEHRLDRVSKECRASLTAASIIGRGFSFELLKELVDLSEAELLDAIEEAEAAQLIASKIEAGKVLYTFFHDLIRQTLLSRISPPRRQRLHLRAAQAMERMFADSLEEHAADLAYHLHEAGATADPAKTVQYLTLAGDSAFRAAAFEEALRLHGYALLLQPPDDALQRARLLFKRGLDLRSLRRREEALADWYKALEMYERLGDAESVGRLCAELSTYQFSIAQFGAGYETASRGLAALGERINAARCILLSASGFVLSNVSQAGYSAANDLFAQALEMAEKLKDERLIGPILGRKAFLHHAYWQGRDAAKVGLRGGDLVQSTLPYEAGYVYAYGAQCGMLWLGRLDEAAKIGKKVEAIAMRSGNEHAHWFAGHYDSFREVAVTGDLVQFENRRKALLEMELALASGWITLSYAYLGRAQFWRGRWGEARESFQKCAEVDIQGHTARLCDSFLFLLDAYSKNREAALAMLGRNKEILPQSGQPNMISSWIMLMAMVEGLAMLEERNEAATLYPLTLEAIATGNLIRPSYAGLVQTIAGIAAAAGGQWEKAEEHYRIALKQAQEIPYKIEQPEVRRWYARMLIERNTRGDKEKARTLLKEAIEMYRTIGMPKHREMAEALLAKS